MLHLKAGMEEKREASALATSNLLQDYWQYPLAKDARTIFAITTRNELLTPVRVPQGIVHSRIFFQATVQRKLEKLNGMILMDGMVTWGKEFDDLLHTMDVMCDGTVGAWGMVRDSP